MDQNPSQDLCKPAEYIPAPTPGSEASTSTINGREDLGVVKMGSEVNRLFSLEKAASAFEVHINWTGAVFFMRAVFFVRAMLGAATALKLRINLR